jgi:carbamoyltransferase
MIILGLNAFHGDSAAAILHWAGFPSEAIAYCLREARASLADVDHIAVNQDGRANLWRKIGYLLRNAPDPALVLDRLRSRHDRAGIPHLLAKTPGPAFRGKIHAIAR